MRACAKIRLGVGQGVTNWGQQFSIGRWGTELLPQHLEFDMFLATHVCPDVERCVCCSARLCLRSPWLGSCGCITGVSPCFAHSRACSLAIVDSSVRVLFAETGRSLGGDQFGNGPGTFTVCGVSRVQRSRCVVYSSGRWGGFSFEAEIARGCEVPVFLVGARRRALCDLTSSQVHAIEADPAALVGAPDGVWTHIISLGGGWGGQTVGDVAKTLGHDKLDVLRLAMHGAEWAVLRTMLLQHQSQTDSPWGTRSVLPDVLLVQFNLEGISAIGQARMLALGEAWAALDAAGYRCYHKEGGMRNRGKYEMEFGFVRVAGAGGVDAVDPGVRVAYPVVEARTPSRCATTASADEARRVTQMKVLRAARDPSAKDGMTEYGRLFDGPQNHFELFHATLTCVDLERYVTRAFAALCAAQGCLCALPGGECRVREVGCGRLVCAYLLCNSESP